MLAAALLMLTLLPIFCAAQKVEDTPSAAAAKRSSTGSAPQGSVRPAPQDLLRYQRMLGELGYGALFTAMLDQQTVSAIKDFQQLRRLPVTGRFDEPTTAQLYEDFRAANARRRLGPQLQLNIGGWESGHILVQGVWRPIPTREPMEPGAGIEITCIREKAMCVEAQASDDKPYTDFYDIESWDRDEIVAVGLPGCAKAILRISRVANHVVMTSSPLSNPGCGASRTAFGFETKINTYELVDSLKGFAAFDARSRQAAIDALKLTEAARKAVD